MRDSDEALGKKIPKTNVVENIEKKFSLEKLDFYRER